MSGGRHGGGRPPGHGDFPGMAARGRGGGWKKSGQAAGREQWAPGSSSNPLPTTAQQAWSRNGGSSSPSGNNWAQPYDRRLAARDNPRPPPQANSKEPEKRAVPNPVVTPPLANGWQWKSRPSGSESNKADVPPSNFDPEMDSSDAEDSSDDYMSDESDSDASAKSFKTRKMNKWFKSFFEEIKILTVEQVLEPTRPWHCPACKNGPGAIDWFKGLQSLVTHASTKGSRRVKLHREFAALLEEEMSGRGTTVVPSGEQFGKWAGLGGVTDREIVWPPMVIVMNTLLEKDDADKWLGMGNQELLDYFSEYDATKARHAYGPGGHRGMSVLIFESSAVGYMEAERLHKHFVHQNTDREAWQSKKARFLPGGKRQLYGFLAKKDDMEDFNKHCQGKSRLKYDMRSHNEMVVVQLKKMSEENQELNYMKNTVVKEKQRSKFVEGSLSVLAQNYRKFEEDQKVFMHRANEKHKEHEEEMKSQEIFFFDNFEKAMEEKECEFEKLLQEERAKYEKLLQEERAKTKHYDMDSETTENRRLRKDQVQHFIDCHIKDVEEFEAERDDLIKAHEKKMVELEKELDAALMALMEKHKPDTFHASSS
uniref:Uncharacterized protein n=1 Tax=Avena sativa TaxID=4498 RepID=A0ACD5WH28_AVESA